MKRFSLIACAALSAAAIGLRLGGQEVSPSDVRPDTGTYVVTDPVEQARELTEDIEVLRTILAREIAVLYAPGADGRGQVRRTGLPFDPARLLDEPGATPTSRSSSRGTAGPMGMAAMGGSTNAMSRGDMFSGMMGGGYDEYMGDYGGAYADMDAGYAYPGGAAATPAPAQPLGTYIEGAGVVYQLELPALREPALADERLDPRNCKYLNSSEWLRTRMELRGELWRVDCRQCHAAASGTVPGFGGAYGRAGGSPFSRGGAFGRAGGGPFLRGGAAGATPSRPARDATAGPTREQLVSRLLDLLAENGRHVRHLAEDERITIAVSVQPRQPQTAAERDGIPGDGMAGYGMPGGGMPAVRPEPSSRTGGTNPARSTGTAGDSGGEMPGDAPGGHGATASGTAVPGSIGSPAGGMGAGDGSGSAFQGPRGRVTTIGGMRPPGGLGAAGGGGLTPDAGSEELAGDLQLRQNKPADAAAAFERAVLKSLGRTQADGGGALPLSRALTGELGRPWTSNERRLYQKLLQSYVAAGRLDSARKLLANWPDDDQARETSTGRPQPPMLLPARLVVSATKGQLDAVASGQLSPEEFRRQARVSFFDPQAAQAGTENDDVPVAVPVSGTVVLNGQPVAAATVEFVPPDGRGRPVTARSGEDGRFTLKLPRGEYNVGVKSVQDGVSRVPERYSAAATSGLRVQISEGRNDFMFELVTQ